MWLHQQTPKQVQPKIRKKLPAFHCQATKKPSHPPNHPKTQKLINMKPKNEGLVQMIFLFNWSDF